MTRMVMVKTWKALEEAFVKRHVVKRREHGNSENRI